MSGRNLIEDTLNRSSDVSVAGGERKGRKSVAKIEPIPEQGVACKVRPRKVDKKLIIIPLVMIALLFALHSVSEISYGIYNQFDLVSSANNLIWIEKTCTHYNYLAFYFGRTA